MASETREVWLFVSELEGLRASSFRQERWVHTFFRWDTALTVFNVRGALHLKTRRFDREEDFTAFRARSRAEAPLTASVREGLLVGLLRRIKHWTLLDLFLPNCLFLLVLAAWRLASRRRTVYLLCSSPPFSLALVGGLLKRLFPRRVVLLVDMRDAWALHPALGGNRRLKRSLEALVFRASDRRLTVSHQLALEFQEAHGRPVEALYNVATHYEGGGEGPTADLLGLDPRLRPGTLKLVYTGSTPEHFYDAEALAGAAGRYRARHPGAATGLQFVCVGAGRDIQKAVDQVPGLDEVFIFLPLVPHDRAKAIQRASDALLFLGFKGEGNKGIISTKFFEYLALGKPILPVTIHPGSDLDGLLTRFAQGTPHLVREEDLAEALERLHQEGTGFLPRCGAPGRLMALYEDYLAFVAALFGEGSRC